MEDALIASIEPIIFLFLFNEFVGIPLRLRGGTETLEKPSLHCPNRDYRIFSTGSNTPPYAFGLIILYNTGHLLCFILGIYRGSIEPEEKLIPLRVLTLGSRTWLQLQFNIGCDRFTYQG